MRESIIDIGQLHVGDEVFVVRRAIVDRIWTEENPAIKPLIRLRPLTTKDDDYSSMFFTRLDTLEIDTDNNE